MHEVNPLLYIWTTSRLRCAIISILGKALVAVMRDGVTCLVRNKVEGAS